MKVVIVGGVAGGASTAARLRRNDENVEIIMFERGPDVSFANCGLPYHIGGSIEDRDNLVLVDQNDFKQKLNVDVRLRSEVLEIDRENKKVKVFDSNNDNSYYETYDKLVLSPGGMPVRPVIPGINSSKIFTLRNLTDMDLIIDAVKNETCKKVAVIGAGFIGLELAENLADLGLNVSIVELSDQVMNIIDYEMSTYIHQHLKAKNVELFLSDAVMSFDEVENGMDLTLISGRKINADVAVLSIGVKPEKKLAEDCGLKIGELGGIAVTSKMLTSDEDIYALGDVIEIQDIVSGKPALIPLANSANKQGRMVADNIMGGEREYKGTPATAIAKVFDLTVATCGNSEKLLKKHNIEYDRVYLQPVSHAGYYPGAQPMILKLLFNPQNGDILGAQIVGKEGIDKRIDVITTLIQMQKTVYDLAALELAYAPPYSSAKDPVNLAGMIAINQIENRNPSVFWNDVPGLIEEKVCFVDVRSKLEFELGHIENAINIPLEEIRNNLNSIKDKEKLIIYCTQGKLAYFAMSILINNGFKNVYNLNGGYKLYKTTTLEQENTDVFDGFVIDKKDDLSNINKTAEVGNMIKVNACGLQCPGPIMKLHTAVEEAKDGDVIELETTDYGFKNDIGVWCERTGNKLISLEEKDKVIIAQVQKNKQVETNRQIGQIPNDKTIVVFSGSLDKALAAFIIANGARAMGREVTLFFTFWGLNILRSSKSVKVKKTILEKMFGKMLPRGSSKLDLSQMNMMGMGSKMIKYIMKTKNVDSLELLIETALKNGVRLIACQMSMDIMGIKKEELIDGVEIAGVASYLGAAELADTNLFI
jgi:NADPH-dependent 2,4-dienoyl-CoA reductase/sulfur reductase-like enzyme/peroxiredoxin family protein/rhodanese-related sulfurtransferase/TusA-related sulfurtransferase